MALILMIAALCGLRFFEVWVFAGMSWWYVIALMVFTFVWFEFFEKVLGLDKKKEHNVDNSRREARVKKAFDKRR